MSEAKSDSTVLLAVSERLKKSISEVMKDALRGNDPALRAQDGQYILWGLVEKIMHQVIDEALEQVRKELEQERKALELAINKLNKIHGRWIGDDPIMFTADYFRNLAKEGKR